MLGTMMDFPLTLQHVFDRGTRLFPDREIVIIVDGDEFVTAKHVGGVA